MAWLGHAPGLYVVYREGLPRALWRPNALAALATLAAMVAVAATGAPWTWTLGAWIAGHAAWGAYLAWRLPSLRPAPRDDRERRGPRLFRCDAACGDPSASTDRRATA